MGLQIAKMQSRWPAFRFVRNESAWHGTLQPTDESPAYDFRLMYALKRAPRVKVLRPDLDPKARFLHRYADGSLCLHFPDDMDWHSGRFLADTIVPWVAEWLFCYECWLIDPDHRWPGDEAPHTGGKRSG
jgi:hypothetical protein